MSSDTVSSVSKGCFAYHGKVARANREDYVNISNDRFIKSRFKLCNELREDLHMRINILRSDLNSKIFDDMVAFTASYNSSMGNYNSRLIGEILTAVLITGVNTPDHDIMFSNLDSMLKVKVTPLIARLKSTDCPRVATLIKNIFQQLANVSVPLGDEDDDDGENSFEECRNGDKSDLECSPVKFKWTVKRKQAFTMSTLVKWYNKNHSFKTGRPSPAKKPKINGSPSKATSCEKATDKLAEMKIDEIKRSPPVIIMLEDAENLNPIVLQDFISLCSSHLDSLPVILVLGIATSLTVIHQLLPTSVSSLLCIETFQAPSASSYLTQLMDKIIMTEDIPFRLGPKVFHFLLDVFLYHDFSILNFIMGFEYSMTEHFLSNPLSLLCCPRTEVDVVISRLTHAQLEDVRRQPAFMRYVEDKSAEDQARLLMDDMATRKLLTEELTTMHVLHAKMLTALRFLHCLCSGLPKHPLGKQLRELYSVCLTQELCKSEGYQQAFSFLRIMSCDDLSQLLGLSLKTLSEAKDEHDNIGRLHEDVGSFIYRLQHIDEEPDDDTAGSENMPDVGRILPKRAKLHELKEKLQSLTSCRKMSPYERLRNTVLDTLHKHFSLLLVCPLSRPLHEIFFFNNLTAIKDQIRAAPRCSIQHALTQPGKILNCPCCQCEADAILPSMPDICIVYKLHLECGTLVNLYDWLQAFVTVISSNENGVGKRNSKPSIELRARFIRAVSELQFLGFIKSTQRKTDHVTRLTW